MKGAASIKRALLKAARWGEAEIDGPPESPRSVFVQRCNDLGDLLVVTPLFEALRRRFPQAEIVAGVGPWSAPLLTGNPHVNRIEPLHLPWHNKYIVDQGMAARIGYLAFSEELRRLRRQRFDIGIDVLGSFYGALMLRRMGVPYRLGVAGYAGGDGGYQAEIPANMNEHVGRFALRFAERLGLGAQDLPENRPQIFLTGAEKEKASQRWNQLPGGEGAKVVIAPGAGFPAKSWPPEHYRRLVGKIARKLGPIAVIGGAGDRETADRIGFGVDHVSNLAGQLDLRQTLALIAGADLVITNPSMALHAAAAFRRPALILLGDYFPSAEQHRLQWDYPGSVTLGREERLGLPLPGPEAAEAALREFVPGI